jgi:hypothetical protein
MLQIPTKRTLPERPPNGECHRLCSSSHDFHLGGKFKFKVFKKTEKATFFQIDPVHSILVLQINPTHRCNRKEVLFHPTFLFVTETTPVIRYQPESDKWHQTARVSTCAVCPSLPRAHMFRHFMIGDPSTYITI